MSTKPGSIQFDHGGVTVRRVNRCNSLATLSSLAIAGLGIAYLPLVYHQADLQAGKLQRVNAQPELPPLEYVSAYRSDLAEPLASLLAQLAVATSTFPKTDAIVVA